MNNLTLRHLRYFDALAQHGHFRRAAEACLVSQPALSTQIKELEEILQAPLVERSTRHVQLTPFGEDFIERAREILLAVDDLENFVQARNGPYTGRLRLGVIPTIAPYFLPDVIEALSKDFPALDLQLREGITTTLIDALLGGTLDFAIVALPISEPSLQGFALFDEEFVLVRQASEADKPVPNVDRLGRMELLLLEDGHCFRDQALSFCNIPSTSTRKLMEGNSLTTLVQMVNAGIGLTLIPEMAIALEGRTADVSIARFKEPKPKRTIGMVWRKTNPLVGQLMQISAIIRGLGQRKLTTLASSS